MYSVLVLSDRRNIVHPQDRVEVNWSRKIAAWSDDDARQSLIVKEIRKVRENQRKAISIFKENSMKINDTH